MKGIGNKLIGNEEMVPLEERIFNFSLLVSICLTAIGAGLDLFFYSSTWTNLIFAGIWILTYYFSRFRGRFKEASVAGIVILIFAFFPYNWIYSSGSSGVLPYYSVVLLVILCAVLKGKFRFFMILSFIAVEMLLICHDAYEAGSFFVQPASNTTGAELMIHMGIILVSISIFIVVYSNVYEKEKARRETYASSIEEHYRQQLYYMKNLEEVIDKLRSERHDFNHYLGVIYGLLETKETEKAGTYVSQLVRTAEEYQNLVNIPYPIARAMLNYKLSDAKEKHILLRLDIRVPAELELPEFDLVVILGNLLDNAVEANKEIDEQARYLALSIFYRPNYLVIHTENPVSAEVTSAKEHKTTKSDVSEHGFGLRNIEYLTKKHDGFLKTSREHGIFKADVALLIGTGGK
ncbi:MAG TPA: GHKL domain-containing protein [Lachnospiraceae bacterium]|nr:GHKL domain-containing protein [Lachnospiraceae bacterium]